MKLPLSILTLLILALQTGCVSDGQFHGQGGLTNQTPAQYGQGYPSTYQNQTLQQELTKTRENLDRLEASLEKSPGKAQSNTGADWKSCAMNSSPPAGTTGKKPAN